MHQQQPEHILKRVLKALGLPPGTTAEQAEGAVWALYFKAGIVNTPKPTAEQLSAATGPSELEAAGRSFRYVVEATEHRASTQAELAALTPEQRAVTLTDSDRQAARKAGVSEEGFLAAKRRDVMRQS